MLLEIAQAIVADVKARHSEGDCPVTRQHSVANLEDALLTIAALSSSAGPAGEVVENLTRQLWEAKYALAKSQEYAQTWHRICQTIATVLGLPEPEEDFAVRVRDWADAHPAPATVESAAKFKIGHCDDCSVDGQPCSRCLAAALAPATEGRKS